LATSFTFTIDCADADRMMQFWTTALGYKPKNPPEGFDDWCAYFRSIGVPEEELHGECTAYLVDPDGVAPQIFLQEVPEPKMVKTASTSTFGSAVGWRCRWPSASSGWRPRSTG
jgi:hypothetical protein